VANGLSTQAPAQTRAQQDRVRVLVVDDERSLTDLVTMALRYEGWDARSAGTGAEAVQTVSR
jgi:two-component system OmpR family response regulator